MTDAAFDHASVMPQEVLEALAPRAGGTYVDATLGGGGHARRILEAGAPDARLIGIDRDLAALEAARVHLGELAARVTFVHAAFGDLDRILDELELPRVDGLLADFGVSSPQLDQAERGFSFSQDGPLDMRMDPTEGETARELLERLDADAIADILYELGEERKSRRIARSIVRARDEGELETTSDLRRAVARAVGGRRGRIDPATRTFQALRIAVNDELGQIRALLSLLPERLEDGGVAVLISFHSLEDRLVKRAFRGSPELAPLTKKPVVAGEAERADNPRARSAKLRAARRVPRAEVAA